jgi:hypothetical protein
MRRCHHRQARRQDDLGWPVPCSWCLGFHGRDTAAVGRRDALTGYSRVSRTTSSAATVCRSSCDTAVLGPWFVAALAPVYVGDLASGRPLLAAHGLTVVCADLPAYGRSGNRHPPMIRCAFQARRRPPPVRGNGHLRS